MTAALIDWLRAVLPGPVKDVFRPIYHGVLYVYWSGRRSIGVNYRTYSVGAGTSRIYYTVETAEVFADVVRDGVVAPEQVPLELLDANKRVEVAVDIGAHVGVYSVLLNEMNPNIDLYSFEPDDTNRTVLRDVLNENDVDSRIRPEVVTAETGTVTFHVDPRPGSERSSTDASDEFEPREKPSLAISDLVEEEGLTGLYLKIDAEGEEFHILHDVFSSQLEYVEGIVEIHPEKLTVDAVDVIDFLEVKSDRLRFVGDSSPGHRAADDISFEHNRPMYYFQKGEPG